MNILSVKNQAKILQDFLKQSNMNVSHSSCLQAMAKIHGFKDWNTLRGIFKSDWTPKEMEEIGIEEYDTNDRNTLSAELKSQARETFIENDARVISRYQHSILYRNTTAYKETMSNKSSEIPLKNASDIEKFLCTYFLMNKWDVKKIFKDYDLDYIKTKIKIVIACKTYDGMVEAFSDLLLVTLKHDIKSTKKLEEIEEKKFQEYEADFERWVAERTAAGMMRIELVEEPNNISPSVTLTKDIDTMGAKKMNLYLPEEMEVNIVRKQ